MLRQFNKAPLAKPINNGVLLLDPSELRAFVKNVFIRRHNCFSYLLVVRYVLE